MDTVGATGRSESSTPHGSLKEGLFWFFLMIFSFADRSSDPGYTSYSFAVLNHDFCPYGSKPVCLTGLNPEMSY
jgi:hypothetical protein